MTAEQALIEENKKDPRKKYITKDINGNTEFWSAKPFINNKTGQWMAEGFLISIVLNDIEIDFSRKDWQECILCIDDIKQEIPPIPEKWYLPINEETVDFINEARFKKNKNLKLTGKLESEGEFDVVRNIDNEIVGYHSFFTKDCKEITLEQFKKYVLCEIEEKQEEIQKSASQAPTVENENTITHFYSTRRWTEDRINYINKFIRKNIDSYLCIPIEWVEERNELVEKLKNL